MSVYLKLQVHHAIFSRNLHHFLKSIYKRQAGIKLLVMAVCEEHETEILKDQAIFCKILNIKLFAVNRSFKSSKTQDIMEFGLHKLLHQDAPKTDNPLLEQPTLAKTHTKYAPNIQN